MRFTILAVCLMLGACEVGPSRQSAQVQFADDLSGYVVVDEPSVERTADNLLRVSVPIRNVSDENIELMVQIEFRDAHGNPYNDETPKRVMLLARGETKHFFAHSMLSKADDFVATIWRNR
ncbi:MAG: hypothetical protein KDB80_09900 [Planctomycetes bacterium]|nr:hypothetical protein [Planctomycetota bacterium]